MKLSKLKYKLLAILAFVAGYSAIVFIWAANTKRGIDASIITTYILFVVTMIVLVAALFIGTPKDKVPGAINAVNAPASMAMYFSIVGLIYTTILYFFKYEKFMVFVILGYVFIFTIFLILFIFSLKQQELINRNPNKIPDLMEIEELPEYLRRLYELCTEENTKKMIDDLINISSDLEVVEKNEDIERIDTAIFEYAAYLRTNINRSEYSNAYNNIRRIKELLENRK